MALRGVKVIELAGLAPAPFCGLMLADFGANVVRIDKPVSPLAMPIPDGMARGKRSISLNLKSDEGKSILKNMCRKSDVLLEPFRAGVMEKMGVGPDVLLKENPKLIYARLTGFGQTGAYSKMAGHDINYVALSGMLSMLGREGQPPTPPINLLADFAGGGMTCAFGIVLALLERHASGCGQVVDTRMAEGSAYLGTWMYATRDSDFLWSQKRGKNLLDSGMHFYDTYETSDGRWMSVGAIEPQFYSELVSNLGLEDVGHFSDPEEAKKIFKKAFKTKTQKEWQEIFDNTDSCVVPVLDLDQAPVHPHNAETKAFLTGPAHPAGPVPRPAPRLTRTPATPDMQSPPLKIGQHTNEILQEFGYSKEEIKGLQKAEIAYQQASAKL